MTTATYTVGYEYVPVVELEKLTAWTKDLPLIAKTALMLIAGPLLGLAFVIGLPVLGIGLAVWMTARALAPRLVPAALVVKRIALFFVAPFVGLVYMIAFPFVGIGALVYYGVRAARK